MTTDALKAAREALEGVKEGPWSAWDRGVGWEVHHGDSALVNDGYRDLFRVSDARFIAYARSGVPALADALEAALAENERMRAELREWRECALYDVTMEGPVFKGWDRSAMDRCRRKAEGDHNG